MNIECDMNEWMNEWMYIYKNEWMYEWIYKSIYKQYKMNTKDKEWYGKKRLEFNLRIFEFNLN